MELLPFDGKRGEIAFGHGNTTTQRGQPILGRPVPTPTMPIGGQDRQWVAERGRCAVAELAGRLMSDADHDAGRPGAQGGDPGLPAGGCAHLVHEEAALVCDLLRVGLGRRRRGRASGLLGLGSVMLALTRNLTHAPAVSPDR